MRIARRAVVAAMASLPAVGSSSAKSGQQNAYGSVPYGELGYGGSRSDCFIATAAVGTANHEDVAALRRFRDDVLLENALGRAFVRAYYATSPPVARWVSRSPRRRAAVRTLAIRPAATIYNTLT